MGRNIFFEEDRGQLSFIEESIHQERITFFVSYIQKKTLELESKFNFLATYKNEMKTYEKLSRCLQKELEEFFSHFFTFYEEIKPKNVETIIKENAEDYHRFCQTLLNYLEFLAYKTEDLNDKEREFVEKIKEIISLDSIAFRSLDRKKVLLLVEQQPIATAVSPTDFPFLQVEESNELLDCLEQLQMIYANKQFVTKNKQMSMEFFVIMNMEQETELNDNQKETYEQIKKNIIEIMKKIIEKDYEKLSSLLKKFDESVQTNIFCVEEQIRKAQEVEERLQKFLDFVFLLNKPDLKKIPIFLPNLEVERHQAMLLGLEYLRRFIYPYSRNEQPKIALLENYIFMDHDFHIQYTNPNANSALYLTKSDLYARVSERNSLECKRKRLQT